MWKHSRRQAIMIDGERLSAVAMAQNRLSILGVCFILAYGLIGVRLLDLCVVQGSVAYANVDAGSVKSFAGDIEVGADIKTVMRRGDVYDRNGFLVSTTLKTPSLHVDPALVLDAEKMVTELTAIIPDLERGKTLAVLKANNRFGWIKRGITPEQQQRVWNLGEPALGFNYEQKRFYPQGALFAHMLGYTDRDGLGLAGVERGYDEILRSGKDVKLTLDLRLQHLVKREVAKAISDFDAKGGVGVILDANTGDILAGVSLPDFDLNFVNTATDDEKFNRLTLGVYELGSMFKIFSTAALLELHDVGMDYTFDARHPIKIGRFSINDYHAQKRIMTVPEVFMFSSNIGSAMMGKMVGGTALRAFYDDLGLVKPLQFAIKEVGAPLVPGHWSDVTTMTAAYGHGIATSPLQMSLGVASIVNGGIAVNPVLIRDKDKPSVKSDVRVISEKTSESMRKLLRLVVTNGTGKNADVDGYAIGGKTGTAEKSVNGRYQRNKLISSFVSAFPIDNPRYVVMVMVDEPKGNKKSYGYATAGWVAAPAVKRIVSSMASVLGMPADQYDAEHDLGASLLPYVYDEKHGGKRLVSY